MITRDNYEEFFLLYIDNELSIADRQRVERFVADHPDLREEWEVLQQCQLQPEQPLAFPDKSTLRKPEGDAARVAAPAAAAVDFLSYIDGELAGKELAATEDFIRRHPQALQELEQWRQTISHPDNTLTFPDKESGQNAGSIAATPAPPAPTHAAPAPMNAPPVPLNALPARATAQTQTPASSTQATPTHSTPSTIISHKKNALPVTPEATAALYPSGNEQKKNEEVKLDPVPREAAGTTDVALAQTVNSDHPVNPDRPANLDHPVNPDRPVNPDHLVTLAVQADIPRNQSSFATQALQQNDADNNSFVEAEQAAPDKGKLRGLFRKVTRAFGKTADRDKDGQRQVLIGAFQFALN